jgi:hypothetical protein|tara:strand:- start:734 stop:970 length:237 start_codon:yes stop_codon:yes gene_type:complete
MSYSIKRICWSDKTYNGYEDNPYWLIKLESERDSLGLNDSGELWRIYKSELTPISITDFTRAYVENVIEECKLVINLI